MKVYAVGGAVRDELLGISVKDRDYVVVGSTPEEMVRLGFRPVGADFPVFLHPLTREEYALARTERKSGRGYKGFTIHTAPDVTLEEDLRRRDLTVNAIARDEQGEIIDPFGGVGDLQVGVLRHVSSAFAEDPVRVLRVARFAARFGFAVADETTALMRTMVDSGEVDALVPERVWQEFARGLMTAAPARMFEVLRHCGALARIVPELDRLFGVPQPRAHHPEVDTGLHVMLAIDCAARRGLPLPVRYAVLVHDLGKGVTPPADWPAHPGHESRGAELVRAISERLRAPHDCRDLGVLVARHHGNVHRALALKPATLLALLEGCDAFRKPARFEDVLAACECDLRGRTGRETEAYPQSAVLRAALAAATAVDAGAIARASEHPEDIRERVRLARVRAIRELQPQQPDQAG